MEVSYQAVRLGVEVDKGFKYATFGFCEASQDQWVTISFCEASQDQMTH